MRRHAKIFNDPVYGFVEVPYGLLFDLVEHPYYQRLRRITQLGTAHYVYPGALHTRFHHALGALHLMQETIDVLRMKGVDITEAEAEAVKVAILLHDIGHGPYSHSLEFHLLDVHHEEMSIAFMDTLNEVFGGQLTLAISIFKGTYKKRFLHQLVSSQLDMDRLDYITRDSFFTGVYEGVIGYDRIIKMLAVYEDELVVEEKGIYSVEKFLVARRLMYWQAYLHKAVWSASHMLIRIMERARTLLAAGVDLPMSTPLRFFLSQRITSKDLATNREEILKQFAHLDDHDIMYTLKQFVHVEDFVLRTLSERLLHRRLFKVRLEHVHPGGDWIAHLRKKAAAHFGLSEEEASYFVFEGRASNKAYHTGKDEIKILRKDGRVAPISAWSDHNVQLNEVIKYYVCYPSELRGINEATHI